MGRLSLPLRHKPSSQQWAFILVFLLPLLYTESPCYAPDSGVNERVTEWRLRRKEVNIKPTQPGQASDFLSAAWVSLRWWFSFYTFIQTVEPVMTQPVGRHKVYLQRSYLGFSLKWAHQLTVISVYNQGVVSSLYKEQWCYCFLHSQIYGWSRLFYTVT